MRIVTNRSIATGAGTYTIGEVADVEGTLAQAWVESGHASYDGEHEGADTGQGDGEEADEVQDEYSEMTVAELRDAAKAEDLSTSGTKAELLARLRGE